MAYELNLRRLDLGALAAGDNLLIAGGSLGAGFGTIRIYQMEFTSSAATVLTPKSRAVSGAQTTVGAAISCPVAPTSVVLQKTDQPYIECRAGESFVWNSTNATTLVGSLWYALA